MHTLKVFLILLSSSFCIQCASAQITTGDENTPFGNDIKCSLYWRTAKSIAEGLQNNPDGNPEMQWQKLTENRNWLRAVQYGSKPVLLIVTPYKLYVADLHLDSAAGGQMDYDTSEFKIRPEILKNTQALQQLTTVSSVGGQLVQFPFSAKTRFVVVPVKNNTFQNSEQYDVFYLDKGNRIPARHVKLSQLEPSKKNIAFYARVIPLKELGKTFYVEYRTPEDWAGRVMNVNLETDFEDGTFSEMTKLHREILAEMEELSSQEAQLVKAVEEDGQKVESGGLFTRVAANIKAKEAGSNPAQLAQVRASLEKLRAKHQEIQQKLYDYNYLQSKKALKILPRESDFGEHFLAQKTLQDIQDFNGLVSPANKELIHRIGSQRLQEAVSACSATAQNDSKINKALEGIAQGTKN